MNTLQNIKIIFTEKFKGIVLHENEKSYTINSIPYHTIQIPIMQLLEERNIITVNKHDVIKQLETTFDLRTLFNDRQNHTLASVYHRLVINNHPYIDYYIYTYENKTPTRIDDVNECVTFTNNYESIWYTTEINENPFVSGLYPTLSSAIICQTNAISNIKKYLNYQQFKNNITIYQYNKGNYEIYQNDEHVKKTFVNIAVHTTNVAKILTSSIHRNNLTKYKYVNIDTIDFFNTETEYNLNSLISNNIFKTTTISELYNIYTSIF